MHYPGMFLEGLRKTTKSLRIAISGPRFEPGTCEYEAEY
jgi:hypothetical protein